MLTGALGIVLLTPILTLNYISNIASGRKDETDSDDTPPRYKPFVGVVYDNDSGIESEYDDRSEASESSSCESRSTASLTSNSSAREDDNEDVYELKVERCVLNLNPQNDELFAFTFSLQNETTSGSGIRAFRFGLKTTASPIFVASSAAET